MSNLHIVRRPQAAMAEDAWPAGWPAALCRVLAARGVCDHVQAQLQLAQMLSPALLGGIGDAARCLLAAIDAQARLLVVGDFDCDGATGTALAVRGLRLLGALDVCYRVPHRAVHGYGLSPGLVEDLVAMAPQVLITVDNGIACLPGVAAAKARGWKVVVTDHHLPGAQLPAADAIVNPNLDGDAFPSKGLAGVGVMFYLLLELRRQLRERGDPRGQTDLSPLLDLVAIGTVADMVPLDRNNRILVAAGLSRIRRGLAQPGVRALMTVAGRHAERITASDIGFALAPRINAAGRLEDMSIGIACLLSDDPGHAQQCAMALDRINAERRVVQQQMMEEAEALADALAVDATDAPAALCLFDPNWHPGVVGLVASRIKDRVNRPVLAFAPAQPLAGAMIAGDTPLRGSARSVRGFHIRDALAAVDARHPGLIERFGGHAMAAGLSIRHDALVAFAEAFVAHAAADLDPALLGQRIDSDGPLSPDEFTVDLAQALAMAGPWGQGFPEPQFDNVFTVATWRVVGERHLRMDLVPAGGGERVNAIHFDGWSGEPPPARLRAVYQLAVDRYREREQLQLLVRFWEAA